MRGYIRDGVSQKLPLERETNRANTTKMLHGQPEQRCQVSPICSWKASCMKGLPQLTDEWFTTT